METSNAMQPSMGSEVQTTDYVKPDVMLLGNIFEFTLGGSGTGPEDVYFARATE